MAAGCLFFFFFFFLLLSSCCCCFRLLDALVALIEASWRSECFPTDGLGHFKRIWVEGFSTQRQWDYDLTFWPQFSPPLALPDFFKSRPLLHVNCFCLVAGLSISATVPGGIYTDVHRSGTVFTQGPHLYRYNDVNYRWVALNDWHYQLDFNGKWNEEFHIYNTINVCGSR